MIPFPSIDPVLVQLGPLAIRWYSLAYIAGFLGGWWIILRQLRLLIPAPLTKTQLDDLLVWVIVGVVLGGRLGYVLFYQGAYYLQHPEEILQLWHGGMAFHGGMVGSIAAIALYCRRAKIGFWPVMDLAALVAPLGLGLGRVANFINGELYGRVSDVPWAMVFPHGGDLPRHPSQLYQAGMEGLLLGLLLWGCWQSRSIRLAPGRLSGIFLLGYATARLIGEAFREPDAQLGFLWEGLTMGQLLSLPMIALGMWLVVFRKKDVSHDIR
jgi:phosphatidylglycerol:prolipoprotein diacylglycerol transferase